MCHFYFFAVILSKMQPFSSEDFHIISAVYHNTRQGFRPPVNIKKPIVSIRSDTACIPKTGRPAPMEEAKDTNPGERALCTFIFPLS